MTELHSLPQMLIRHGQAKNNTIGLADARVGSDGPLTRLGRLQAEATGRTLTRLIGSGELPAPRHIATSPLERTDETAHILAKALGAKVLYDSNLGEVCHGDCTGMPVLKYLDLLNSMTTDQNKFLFRPPGGENFLDMALRMRVSILEHRALEPRSLFVSHDNPIQCLIG